MSNPLTLLNRLASATGLSLLGKHRRKTPADHDLQILDRLLIAETREAFASFAAAQVAEARQYVATLELDNRYKAGTATMVLGGGGETITLTGRNADGIAHAVTVADPSAAGASLSTSTTVGAAGAYSTTVSLATSQHTLTTVLGGGGETIVSTGKDGKAHSLAFVDPGAAGASLSKSVSVGATGIRTIAVNLATSQHALTVAIGPAAETIVVTGRDGKAHTVEIAAGGALSTSVSFNPAGVAAIVVTKNDGVSTVAEVLAELNSGTAGTLVSAALGTANGAEIAQTVGAAPLAGGGVITSTIAQVVAELNKDDSGEVINTALGTANGAETAIAVAAAPLAGGGTLTSTINDVVAAINGSDAGEVLIAALGTANGAETSVALAVTPLASMTATATATKTVEFGVALLAGTATAYRVIADSVTGADNSTAQVTNAATAAAITTAEDIDQADNNTVITGTIDTAAVAAGTRLQANLVAAAGANVKVTLALEIIHNTGVGSAAVTLLSTPRGYYVSRIRVSADGVAGANGTTVIVRNGATTVASSLTIDIADAGTDQDMTIVAPEWLAGGALVATVAAATGATVNLRFTVEYAIIKDPSVNVG